jgi:uncharacterized protein (TIGR02145 family)
MQLFKKKAYTLYYENECLNCIEHNVTIGTQTWTGCNLNVTTYRNGDPIPQVTDQTDWSNLTTGAWCHINNNPANDAIYGKLYNWYAVNDTAHGGLAPLGYHVPSYPEWDILIDSLGGDTVAGGKLKEVGLCHWLSPNTDATDQVLFTALPGGFRGGNGSFGPAGYQGQWWTSTEYDTTKAWMKYLLYNYEGVGNGQPFKNGGMSVRLIQDEILSCLNIEVYPPILNPGTNHVVEYLDCDGITQIVTVPNGGTMVTICATEIIANNLNGLTQPLYTLCSPPEPLVCSTYSVAPGFGTIEVEGYLGYNIVNYLDCDGNPQTISVAGNESTQYICATEITGGNMGGGAVLETDGICTIEPPEFDFTLSQTCSGLNITLVANSIVGGTGPYQFSTTTFSNISDALDNTTWATASTSKNYPLGNVPGIYWVSIKDSLGMITASVIDADCWDSLTATREPAVISDSSSAFISEACGFDLSGTASNHFIATRIPHILSIGDRVFMTDLPGVVPFDGTVLGAPRYWTLYLAFGFEICPLGLNKIALIDEQGFILEVQCCPVNEQTNGV